MAKKSYFGATKYVGEKAADAVFTESAGIYGDNLISDLGNMMRNFVVVPLAFASLAAAVAIDIAKSPIVLAINEINKSRDAKTSTKQTQDQGMDGKEKVPHTKTTEEKEI